MPEHPFLPYGRQSIDEDDIQAVVEALRSDFLTTGPRVAEFERALALRVGAREVVAVSNGTAALHAAYVAAELGPGDEVVVPAMTFLATANAARYVGADPVFADVDPRSGLVTPETVARAMTPRTAAVVPVHLTGQPVDMARLREVAGDAVIIEDAAHALGAEYAGEPIGNCRYAAMAVFSFHPVKHVTTGEGGAISTNDDALAVRLRRFRSHGMVHGPEGLEGESPGPWYYEQQDLGYNYRITDIQCALGTSQLRKLDAFVARRRALADRYDSRLAHLDHAAPIARARYDSVSALHLYSVLVDFEAAGKSRAAVMTELRARGVGTQVHYIPVPAQPYYRARGADPARYPGALSYYARTLSLPMFPAMRDEDVDRVVDALGDALRC